MNQDILIHGNLNHNRALNGDIVCVEILPQSEWLDNFKSAQPLNILLNEAEEALINENHSDNEQDGEKLENKPQLKLIEAVNQET